MNIKQDETDRLLLKYSATSAILAQQEIDRLRAVNARLVEALQSVVDRRAARGYTSVNRRADDMAAVAMTALAAAKEGK